MSVPMQAAVSLERAREYANADIRTAGVTVEVPGVLGLLTLRADPQQFPFANVVQTVTGLTLPGQLVSTVRDTRRLRWLSPDEWLLSCPIDEVASLEAAFREHLSLQRHASVTEVSGAWCVFYLDGPELREVLAQCVTIDLDPRKFAENRVVNTVFAKAGATLTQVAGGRIEVICRRSFADYVLRFLANAATEAGGLALSSAHDG